MVVPHRDPYQTLGVSREATDEEIRAAYRFKVLAYHPDRFARAGEPTRRLAEDELKAVNAAFALLTDRQARAAYDRAAEGGSRATPGSPHDQTTARPRTFLERVPRWVIVAALLLYLLSPIDLVPELLPRIGLLDDLIIALAVAYLLSAGRLGRPGW